ncbi:MAG: T9SS type A sorting domain-containing protein [Bacteroidota bacterium]|nr:T9SS type A sorting domain-containing protein [Bacteroidota bacterium]
MKSKLLIYFLPVLLVSFLIYGYSTQDDPRNDVSPQSNFPMDVIPSIDPSQSDTATPPNFPYPKIWGWDYSGIAGVNGGTVGACYFQGKYILNRWNLATLYRFNPDGTAGGPGTLADENTAYNGGTGAIRDMTVGPDGSGRNYLWGGAAGTALYKMDSIGNRVAQYTHAGAAYRAIAWDPNRKGFWSCNFTGNIVCRDTNGVVLKTITNTLGGKYGMGFDSTSSADSAFLWVWSQNFTVPSDTTNDLVRVSIATGLATATYNFNKGSNIAGGAEVFVKDNKLVLCLNFQNYAVAAYNLKDLTPVGGGTITVCRNGIFKQIPENGGNANPAIDTLTVSGIPAGNVIQKISVKIDTVIHTYIGDLRFWLTHNTSVDTIISRVGYTGTGFGNSCNDFIGTNLVDSVGPINIQNIPSACIGTQAQTTGTFNPKAPLAALNGIDPNGAYILRIADNAGGDTGRLRAWCVTIKYGPLVGVSNNVSVVEGFRLSQNYPNPFNPTTKIDYSIPKSGVVTIKIYDVIGKEVATLVNEFKNAGNYDIRFNGANFSSGVYFYRIESGNFVDTKKMFLLK